MKVLCAVIFIRVAPIFVTFFKNKLSLHFNWEFEMIFVLIFNSKISLKNYRQKEVFFNNDSSDYLIKYYNLSTVDFLNILADLYFNIGKLTKPWKQLIGLDI